MSEFLWDRLSGCLMLYVENYYLANRDTRIGNNRIKPSAPVDYEIGADILAYLENTLNSEDPSDAWYLVVSGCKKISDLPREIKELTVQFLPRFFEQYPIYKDEECLKDSEGGASK